MKENYIYQILKQFFVNSYPSEIEEKVQKWIIDDKWTTEKIMLCLSFGMK